MKAEESKSWPSSWPKQKQTVPSRLSTQRPTYYQQLSMPEWKRFSHKLKEEAGWKCQECGDPQSPDCNLEVHHIHYSTGSMIWEYPRARVIVVCPACHHDRQMIEQRILGNVAEILRTKNVLEMQDQPIYAFFSEEEINPSDFQ